MTYDHIRVEPLSTALGAEISGIDLAAPPAEPALSEIRHAFGQYGVIFFPRPAADAGAAPCICSAHW